ncbi:MAG: methionine synthase [Termitinemataceae bacterium]|nr:MAG: methionine synthase [Termitinemataceae bacterium]
MKYEKSFIEGACRERILLLDGAMGTMIQKYKLQEDDYRGREFASSKRKLAGCNDLLCLTNPKKIIDIHKQYLAAGTDITKTCSFNANAVSLADYGLQDYAYRISKEAALIARSCADDYAFSGKPHFVAGVLGPTGKSASISPDMDDPGARSISFDELSAAYYDNARGLFDGGADIFLLETIFDTLNAKAAIYALLRLFDEKQVELPIMISAAIADAAGRLLAGQTVEAFYTSMMHAKPLSLGLNCSLGAKLLQPHIEALSRLALCNVSAHPNAGLPNELGVYTESPSEMAAQIAEYVEMGFVNIVGGCCGTTPQHIEEIANVIRGKKPRKLPQENHKTFLCGFDMLEVPHSSENANGNGGENIPHKSRPELPSIVIVGESGNAPGSKVFLNLINTKKYDDALRLIRKNIEQGASIVDICMDDGLLDSEKEIVHFVKIALSDPDIAKVPFVIDSSRFNVIEAALKCIAGKVIANSISLKEGETEFLRRTEQIRRLGAAVMIMLFDEKGQADTYDKKVAIAVRSYNLLIKNNFPPHDIFFDPNILAVATGLKEHDRYALDFIDAAKQILKECPYVHISAGVSNLSYSFRGNQYIRNAIHAVFLKYAHEAGLSAAIVNIACMGLYENLEPSFREAIADMLLCRKENASEILLDIASGMQNKNAKKQSDDCYSKNQNISVEDRIVDAMIRGNDDTIVDDVLLMAHNGKTVLEIVEGPLMAAMQEIGVRFDRAEMFLPQVIRSARVMKKAVAALEPYLTKADSGHSAGGGVSQMQKIVMATVKGDVHDIGKNIAGTVLACTGFRIIDLGVMVEAHTIIDAAIKENASAIGLSGLVTPSLDEMINVAAMMQMRGLKIPLLIGGAAASLTHTALKIVPQYKGPVAYISDAGHVGSAVRALLSETQSAGYYAALQAEYEAAVIKHNKKNSAAKFISIEAAQENKLDILKIDPSYKVIKPRTQDLLLLNDFPLENIIEYFNWNVFLSKWFKNKSAGKKTGQNTEQNIELKEAEKTKLKNDAQALLNKIISEKIVCLRGAVKIFSAQKKYDDIFIDGKKFCFPRNREEQLEGGHNLCLSDFLLENDYLGFFILSAGFGCEKLKEQFEKDKDDYNSIILSLITDNLAECFSSAVHKLVQTKWWGYNVDCADKGEFAGIRPAFGYPCCPDHTDKQTVFDLLQAKTHCGLSLTESYMIQPVSSVCGMYFAYPGARYFSALALCS